MKVRVQSGKVSIEHFGTNSMIVDPLKVLSPRSFVSILLMWELRYLKKFSFSGSLKSCSFVIDKFYGIQFKDKFGLFSAEIRFRLTL